MTEHELDRMLDAALETYVAEAPADLTPRVLARVRRRPVMRPLMMVAAAAALVLVTLAVVGRRNHEDAPMSRPQPLVAQSPAPGPAAVKAATRRITPRPRPSRPRLTSEEQQLVSLVATHPELVAQALAPPPALTAPEPLAIAPIHIEPLTNPQ